jgi:phosphoribosyl 1,2-cyclic phosphate phosphodiesterase
VNKIPDKSLEKLQNLDILIIDALRYKKHSTHFNLEEALDIIRILKPAKAYLTHIAHQIKHSECQPILPENVYLAYDGLTFNI